MVQQTQVLHAEQRYMRDEDEVGGLEMGFGSISLLQLRYSLALTVHDWTMTNELWFLRRKANGDWWTFFPMADKGQWYFLAAVLFGRRYRVREHSSMVACSSPSQQWENSYFAANSPRSHPTVNGR